MFTDVDQRQMATRITRLARYRVPRQGRQDAIQQFRSGFAGPWKPLLLRHCVWRRPHRVGPDQVRQRCPGPNDDRNHDIVMMDDFIYGEPQLLP